MLISQKFRTGEKTVPQTYVVVVKTYSKTVLVRSAMTKTIGLVINSAKNVPRIILVNRTGNAKSLANSMKDEC